MNLTTVVALIGVLLVPLNQGLAQTAASGDAVAVEHSVPFGTIPGRLLLLGSYLVFVDEQQPAASFVVPKSAIESLNADGSAITVQTNEAIRNRSGEVRRLSFRVVAGADPAAVTSWYGSGAAAGASAPTPAASAAGTMTYQARHDHRFGECRGSFIVGPDQASYESVSEVSHSRRWQYQSIKEAALPNPYELEIKPFAGGTYKLRFDGTGMDPAAYKELVGRITSARANR